jgi:site-specific recombinase XerD
MALLVDRAKVRAAEAKSKNTKRAYRSDWKSFETWCIGNSVAALPAAPEVVAAYVTHLAEVGRKTSSIDRALVSISQAHKMSGHNPSPTSSAAVRETLKGIKRHLGTAPNQKAPLLVEHLTRIVELLGDSLKDKRDKALLLVGFAGGFRRSELVALDLEHVEFVAQGAVINLIRSKTDQEGRGRKVGIPFGRRPITCPIRALRAWLEASDITSGPLFRSVTRHGYLSPKRLCRKSVALIIKRVTDLAGYDSRQFSGHSLRAGLATAAAQAGKSERVIMATTGHRSEKMVRRYIREGSLFSSCASEGLL